MTIHTLEGDLLFNRINAQAIAHGCNCKGVMGAGIAKQIAKLYGQQMFKQYRLACQHKTFQLGSAHLWNGGNKLPYLFNLGTQYNTGRDARFISVYQSLINMKLICQDWLDNPTIALPQIGCGIGGLKWESVEFAIREIFSDYPSDIWLYIKFIPNN